MEKTKTIENAMGNNYIGKKKHRYFHGGRATTTGQKTKFWSDLMSEAFSGNKGTLSMLELESLCRSR